MVDTLCKQLMGGNAAVACSYFDLAAPEGQSPAAVLGSVLLQVVGGLEEVPAGIAKAFQGREKISDGG